MLDLPSDVSTAGLQAEILWEIACIKVYELCLLM